MVCENGIVQNNARCNLACSETLQGGQCTCNNAGCVAVSSCDKCQIENCKTFFPDKKVMRTAKCKSSHSHSHHRPSTNDKGPPTCESIGVKSIDECNAYCGGASLSSLCSGSDCYCKCNTKVMCEKTNKGSGAGVWIAVIFFVLIGSAFGYVWWKKKNGERLPEFIENLPFIGRSDNSGMSGDSSYQKI